MSVIFSQPIQPWEELPELVVAKQAFVLCFLDSNTHRSASRQIRRQISDTNRLIGNRDNHISQGSVATQSIFQYEWSYRLELSRFARR